MPENNEVAELIADVKERVLFMQEIGVMDMKVDLASLEVGEGTTEVQLMLIARELGL